MQYYSTRLLSLLISPAFLLITACGGGGDDVAPDAAPAHSDASALSTTAGTDLTARIAAATATAQSSTNACGPIHPFYWEIGDRNGKQASASVNCSTSSMTISSTTSMSIASASKWLYGAYVAQKRSGMPSAADLPYLSMRSGYTNFGSCQTGQTVDSCLAYGSNGVVDASTVGEFDYGGGHMQKHASLMGMGAMNSKALATELMGQLGTDVKIGYGSPQLAGGVYTSSDVYARFLRKLLGGQLLMGGLLGQSPVCTNKLSCPSGTAVYAPIPPNESWHYSIAHWVEDDPVVGDGAFSSPGALGFYPWIDATRSYYGVLARSVPLGAFDSVQCGRLIRKAWAT